MQDLLIPGALALVLGLFVSGPLAQACSRAGWLDPPGGHKTHTAAVPFGGALFVLPTWWLLYMTGATALFWIGGWILLVGLAEDVLKSRGRELPWWLRLALFLAGLSTLPLFFSPGMAPAEAWAAAGLLLGAVISFNWLDHSDGLVAGAGAGVLAALSLGGSFSAGSAEVSPLGVPLGLICAFLVVNGIAGKRAILYLGDSGAQLLGYSLVGLGLVLARPDAGTGAPGSFHLVPALLFGTLPLLDAVRVVLTRMMKGIPPWRPDQQFHLGHLSAVRTLPRGVLPLIVAAVSCGLAWLGLSLGRGE